MSAKFITLEGIEGVGKSTNLEFIKSYLQSNNIDFVTTREPGGTKVAESLRQILLFSEESLAITTETLLMFAARAQNIKHIIKPALSANKWVLSDRFTDATYAYQGGGRGVSDIYISALEDMVQAQLRPDLCILLDAPVEIALKRISIRNKIDNFEKMNEDFFTKIRQKYLARAKANPDRYAIVDASLELDLVQKQIANVLQHKL